VAFLANLAGGTSIGDALIRIGADTRQMRAEMAALNAQTRAQLAQTGQNIERQTAGWGRAFTAVKIGLAGLGLGLGLFALAGIKAAREFDRAMGQVYALTGISTEALKQLKQETLALAKVMPQSPKELAEGLYYIISSGFEAADAMKILEAAAMDAAVGMTDVQTVADGLTSAMNAYAVSGEKAAEFSDVMTNTIVEGKAEWGDLARSIGAVSVQGATAGVTFKEVSSAIANLTLVGLTAQRGSRNLAFLIRALNAPNNIAAKTFENLGLKVDETTLKEKGLIGMLQMMSQAAGEHHDVIVRNTKGQIDWDKSAQATAEANKGWAKSMQTMTGGAAGFLVAQILLQQNGEKYNGILKSMDETAGLTVSSFERMKEADPGMMFDILKNRVMVAAIEFGSSLMPTLTKFVAWLTEAVPHAFEVIGDVWRKYLQGPVTRILDAFGKLGAAIGRIFGGDASAEADGFATVLGGIASVIGQIVDYAATLVGFMADIFGNPVVQAISKVVGALLILRFTMRTILGIGGGLDQRFRGMARSLSGGLLFRNQGAGATGGDPALDRSAGHLTGAATELRGAAAALKGSAAAGRAGGMFGAGPYRNQPGPLNYVGPTPKSTGQMGGTFFGPKGQLLAVGASQIERDFYMRNRAALGAAGKNIVARAAGGVMDGIRAGAGALRRGGSAALGAASGGLGLVSRAFWPLMVASLAGELIKEPLGNLLGKLTPWKRAAASLKEDFVGGLVNMVKSWQIGSDLFVALPKIDFGKISIKTEDLRGLDLSDPEIERLTAGGLTGALEAQRLTPEVIAGLRQRRDESVQLWFARIRGTLEDAGLSTEAINKVIPVTAGGGNWLMPSATELGAAGAQIDAMVTNLAQQAQTSVQEVLQQGVEGALYEIGFRQSDLLTIPPAVREQLATLFQNGVSGEFSGLMVYIAEKALRDAGALRKNVTAADVLARQPEPDIEALRERNRIIPTMTRAMAADQAFAESLGASVRPAQQAYAEWFQRVASDPTGVQQALRDGAQAFLDQWAEQIRNAKTPKAQKALAAKMHMTWEQAQALLAQSEAATGKPLLDALTAQLRNTILQAAKDGSADAADDAASVLFANLGDKGLWGKLAGKYDKEEIAKIIAGDPKSADAQKLRRAFAKWFPKGSGAGTAKGFADAYQAWVDAGMLDSSKPEAWKTAAGMLPDIAADSKMAMDDLRESAVIANRSLGDVSATLRDILNAPHYEEKGDPGSRPGQGGGGGGGPGGHHAMGGRTPYGEPHWVGEFGPELRSGVGSYNITSNSKVRSMIAELAQGAARAMMPSRGDQHLNVDNMYLNSGAERESILEAVAFLAPAGR
jgi:hypothetical protein